MVMRSYEMEQYHHWPVLYINDADEALWKSLSKTNWIVGASFACLLCRRQGRRLLTVHSPKWLPPLSQLVVYRCALGAHFEVISPRFTPCTGPRIPGSELCRLQSVQLVVPWYYQSSAKCFISCKYKPKFCGFLSIINYILNQLNCMK